MKEESKIERGRKREVERERGCGGIKRPPRRIERGGERKREDKG